MTGTIVSAVLAVLGFAFKLLPKKSEAEKSNDRKQTRERLEADQARQTEQESNSEQDKINNDTDAASQRIHNDSLHDAAEELATKVDSANRDLRK